MTTTATKLITADDLLMLYGLDILPGFVCPVSDIFDL